MEQDLKFRKISGIRIFKKFLAGEFSKLTSGLKFLWLIIIKNRIKINKWRTIGDNLKKIISKMRIFKPDL